MTPDQATAEIINGMWWITWLTSALGILLILIIVIVGIAIVVDSEHERQRRSGR